MGNPLISICIPSYNRPQYLRELLLSVLSQTYINFEIIIYDDWSPQVNKIQEIVETIGDKRIKLFLWENVGFIKNWNRCLSHCQGEYIKLVWDDDILYPTCLEIEQATLEKNKNVGITICNYDTIDGKWKPINNKSFNKNSFRLFQEDKREDWRSFIKNYFLWKRRVWLPTSIMFKKSVFEKTGFFNEKVGSPADIEYWLRIARNSDIYYIDNALIKMRWHEQNLSKSLDKDIITYKNTIYIVLFENRSYINLTISEKKQIFLRYFKMWIQKSMQNPGSLLILSKVFIDLFIIIFTKRKQWLFKKYNDD